MKHTLKKLMTREIPTLSRACCGTITLGDVCKASLGGLGLVLVLALIVMGGMICAVLRMGTL